MFVKVDSCEKLYNPDYADDLVYFFEYTKHGQRGRDRMVTTVALFGT